MPQIYAPFLSPLPPFKGSEVWARNLYRVYEGVYKGTLLRAYIKGPCNHPKMMSHFETLYIPETLKIL